MKKTAYLLPEHRKFLITRKWVLKLDFGVASLSAQNEQLFTATSYRIGDVTVHTLGICPPLPTFSRLLRSFRFVRLFSRLNYQKFLNERHKKKMRLIWLGLIISVIYHRALCAPLNNNSTMHNCVPSRVYDGGWLRHIVALTEMKINFDIFAYLIQFCAEQFRFHFVGE